MVWLMHKGTIEETQRQRLSHPAVVQLLTSKANRQFVRHAVVSVAVLMTKHSQQVIRANYGCSAPTELDL